MEKDLLGETKDSCIFGQLWVLELNTENASSVARGSLLQASGPVAPLQHCRKAIPD